MLFGPEHEELRRSIRKFVDKEINPFVDEWEEAGIFPAHDLFKKLGNAGFLGITKPVEYGGMGLDLSYGVVMAEELGYCMCGGVPLAIGVQTDMCTPALSRFGTKELNEEFLVPSIAGDFVGCIGVSEPGAGSDVAGLKTFARKDGDDYLITGQKMWITSGTQADWMCMLARTDEGPPHKSLSLLVVPMNLPGITIEKKLDKIGMRSSDTAVIHFEDVRVPQKNRIGEEGGGFVYQMLQFQEERLWGAANMVTGLVQAIENTKEYTRTRKTFGRPILDNQYVHFKLAELSTEVEALRSLIYRCVEEFMNGQDITRLASMAKLKGGRLGREVADWCLQFHGGMGYVMESHINRFYRDVRLASIGGGADEIMLGIICKLEGTLPRKS